jgi:hypothetical protein
MAWCVRTETDLSLGLGLLLVEISCAVWIRAGLANTYVIPFDVVSNSLLHVCVCCRLLSSCPSC